MPLATTPGATALLYARNKVTGETYFVGESTPGAPYVIVGDFGEQHVPADLPVSGAIPADWDAVGDPAHQMVRGEGLIYSPFDMNAVDAGYLFSFVGTDNPTGWVRAGRLTGMTGPTGVSSVIVGDFGAATTPADLPPDGLIPIDWDGPGNPTAPLQMEQGWSLYYDQPTDTTLDGHLFQYVGVGIDPAGWLDIGLIQGPAGPPGQIGPEGPQSDDIYVGPDDPTVIKPTTELWFDTDDTRLLGPYDLPLGGATYMALTKKTDLDGDIEWRDVYVMPSGKVLQFPNVADVAKINLYATTFGLGITSGTMNLFASTNIRFNKDSITGAEWAVINANGVTVPTGKGFFVGDTWHGWVYDAANGHDNLRSYQGSWSFRKTVGAAPGTEVARISEAGIGPRMAHNVSFQNGFSGTMDFNVTPAMVTMRITQVHRNANTAHNTQTKICDYPAGVPAPPGAGTVGWRTPIQFHASDFSADYQKGVLHLDGTSVWLIVTGSQVGSGGYFEAVMSWPRG